ARGAPGPESSRKARADASVPGEARALGERDEQRRAGDEIERQSQPAAACPAARRVLGQRALRRLLERERLGDEVERGPEAHHGVTRERDEQPGPHLGGAPRDKSEASSTSSKATCAGIQKRLRDTPPRSGWIRSKRRGQAGSTTLNSYRPPPSATSASASARPTST